MLKFENSYLLAFLVSIFLVFILFAAQGAKLWSLMLFFALAMLIFASFCLALQRSDERDQTEHSKIFPTFIITVAVYPMFFLLFTPIALLFRLCGRHRIAQGFDRSADSYWIDRTSTKLPLRNFNKQY